MKKFVDFIASSSLFTLIGALELAIILFFGWCFGEIFLTSPMPLKKIPSWNSSVCFCWRMS